MITPWSEAWRKQQTKLAGFEPCEARVPAPAREKIGIFYTWGLSPLLAPMAIFLSARSAGERDAGTQQATAGAIRLDSALESNARPCVDTGQNGQCQAAQSDGTRRSLLCVRHL